MSSASALPDGRRWQLRPSPKYAAHGVVRTVPPAVTVRRVLPLMGRIGVTRIGEVTGLDRVGIPNYTAVRPAGLDGISYYNGKGATRADAKAGALMEAIERASGEECDHPVHYGTRAEMEQAGPTIDPTTVIVPWVVEYTADLRLEWVEGFDLLGQQPTFVPLNAVVCPYQPPAGRPTLHWSSSNGLASGNTMEEALCQALCEVVERDAEAVAHTALRLQPAVAAVLACMGMAPARGRGQEEDCYPLVALDTLPPRAAALARRLTAAGLRIYLRNATSTGGIATLECTVVEPLMGGRWSAYAGNGTHPDARVAVSRALTEAAQSRVACIQGGREDLPDIVRGPRTCDPDRRFGQGRTVPFSSVPSYVHDDIADDIRFLLARLQQAGFAQVVAVDMTRPELGVPVVRLVVPGAEAWPVFEMHARRAAFGPRIALLLEATHPVAHEMGPGGTP
ncbi:MAG: YcaO-like family protein [Candidatus Latescibacterota bacterium]